MQTIRFAMDVTMQWADPLLVWTPTAGSGLTILKVPEDSIWTPDATFYAA
ncbi:unnamed protein product [Heligmosomoides polygyrus]|uniref:Neur_chan_LBD domain-containing protein n=1 Tax=Heligmosomoides polygyrus TaxID=6339 RepID=A0A183FBC0_HELPZ|nr:unnamed protein product [Heligmosomoides polygyrus]